MTLVEAVRSTWQVRGRLEMYKSYIGQVQYQRGKFQRWNRKSEDLESFMASNYMAIVTVLRSQIYFIKI